MLTRSLALLCAASETMHVTGELQKLLPVLFPLLDPPVSKGTAVSAAHVIVMTSHEPQRRGTHLQDCPVLARTLPLTAVADHTAFLKRPCLSCLKRRVHFLASEHFCRSLAKSCWEGGGTLPREWEAIATRHFGSVMHLGEELVKYATSRREPGWTWLVYDIERDEDRRLVVMNIPANRTPLALGLWPLAVIDMTEKALLEAINARSLERSESLTPPSWSRAARSSLAAVGVADTRVSDATDWNLSAIREQIAREAVSKMNWSFVLHQWQQAMGYYTSADRDEKIRARFGKLEREACLAAVSRLRDSGATVLRSDNFEIIAKAEGGNKGNGSDKSRFPGKKIREPEETSQEVVAGSTRSTSKEIPVSGKDPECTQLSDGTWQYAYQNGDITLLRPDGARVFKKRELTTTVYADGGTHYEYPNNTSIFDRADGVRVTTFADGTTKEERWK